MRIIGLVTAASMALAGCATAPNAAFRSDAESAPRLELQPVVERTALFRPDRGYVAGSFATSDGGDQFAFGIVNALDHEWVMPFVSGRGRDRDESDADAVLIELPPGDYRLLFWVTGTKARRMYLSPESALGRPFTLKPGHVVFLGQFEAKIQRELSTAKATIDPKVVPADEAWTELTTAYPGFVQAAIECVFCKAPRAGADAGRAAAPALREAPDFARSHQVVIHYHRAAADRTPKLIAWDERDGTRRELVRASKSSPSSPTERDEFGPYWTLNDLNFPSRTVRFGIQYREEPLDARSFPLSQGREVWINAGDPKVYFSREEAIAAHGDEERPAETSAEESADESAE